jgi:hypothetical protein
MTNIASVSDQGSIIDNADLPRPVVGSVKNSSYSDLPRPLAKVVDSGRISFGAGLRLPLSK